LINACFTFSIMQNTTKEAPGKIRETTQHLTDHLGELLESYYRLGVLNITDKATGIASFTITIFVVTFLVMFAVLFMGFGLGWWLGDQLGSRFAGFAVVAGILILIIITIMAFRKRVLFPFIRNIIIKKVYE
jgi:hypothetical protein